MGLTRRSVGFYAAEGGTPSRTEGIPTVALAGNPNVGKSTVFNALTGMHQHTGNWPGKTVASAVGTMRSRGGEAYALVDLPGTYSLLAHSVEEEVARNFLCFGDADATVVVCDATCLERNLNLVLQTLEITSRVIVCVNLLDEAARRGIRVDLPALSKELGVPVVGTSARKKSTLRGLVAVLDSLMRSPELCHPTRLTYSEEIEDAIRSVSSVLSEKKIENVNIRWLSMRLLENDEPLIREAESFLGIPLLADSEISFAVAEAQASLFPKGADVDAYRDRVVGRLVARAGEIAAVCVRTGPSFSSRDEKIDRILTGRLSAYPIMLLFLGLIFFLTVYAANLPSALLSAGLFWVEDRLTDLFFLLGAPAWLHGLLVLGMYRTLAWVVSVMLPPMAIFFPLFTLLEDAGYLPRIAYNLDRPFRACRACGKQALTMCMGFGCNAAGVVGCRIMDSGRERTLAILTNSLVPCNGRFPMIITLLSLFFVGRVGGALQTFSVALLLTALILLSVLATFAMTALLSHTVLRGTPSSFTLELPPYRRPEVGRVLIRSLFDRTLFVLGRAAAVAAPAGALIWLLSNLTVGEGSLLSHAAAFLDPVGRVFGMDGVILLAFLLGFPANEIVIPVMLMAYTATGTLAETGTVAEIADVFVGAGWTPLTAVSTTLFALFHFPCSTTLLSIGRETRSFRDTALAFFLPLALGLLLCFCVSFLWRLLA